MTDESFTKIQREYIAAMREAVALMKRLDAEGREDRAAGLAVAVDLGTSAAFMFSVTERDYWNATNVVREAIKQATREED